MRSWMYGSEGCVWGPGPGAGGVLVMEDGVGALIVVKSCPCGCADARGGLPACLVTQMSATFQTCTSLRCNNLQLIQELIPLLEVK